MPAMDSLGMWDKIPTPGQNWQNCECGHGVPVLDRYEGHMAVFKCGCCNAEHSVPTRRNGGRSKSS